MMNYQTFLANVVYGQIQPDVYNGSSQLFYSRPVTAASFYGGYSGTQTASILLTNFSGVITFQATLNDLGEAKWFDVFDVTGAPARVGNAANSISTATTLGNIAGNAVVTTHYAPHRLSTSDGNGVGATFDVVLNGNTLYAGNAIITLSNDGGHDYALGDTVTVPGTELYGLSPANDLTFTLGGVLGNVTTGTTAITMLGSYAYMRVAVKEFTAGTINSVTLAY